MASRRSAAAAPRRPNLRVVRGDERPSRRQRAANRRLVRKARRLARDPMPRTVALLLVSAFLLTGIGLVMVLSASSVTSFQASGDSFLYLKRQAVYAAIGVVALFVTFRVSYRRWERLAVPLLLVSVALLGLALHPSIGSEAGGSSRWIQMGPVTIQPSELTKLAMVVFAAMILTRKWRRLDEPLHLAIPLAPVVLVVCGLIILQRDLGTTTIIALSTMVLVFACGARMRYLLLTGIAALGAGWFLIMGEAYRRDRFLSFLHPWQDRSNTGYQLIQSLLGLGSGGMFGVGLGASRAKWSYIPNAHTDFIFSILGEELGLLGELVVLGLFVTLIYSGFRIASRVNDTFGRLLATGIVAWLAVQTLINLGAVTGILPVTGVPLPFVSFGGSSLIVTLAAVGILANVGRTAAAEQGWSAEESERAGRRAARREARRTRRLAAQRAKSARRPGKHERRPAAARSRGPASAKRVVRTGTAADAPSRKAARRTADVSAGPGSGGEADALGAAATRWRHPAGKGMSSRPAVHRADPSGRSSGSRRHAAAPRSKRSAKRSARRSAKAPAPAHGGGRSR
ncbi:MAG TPA: putative lipid II flippase FtsW [Actinomycetota bacterium]|nr:putative lipid II flippase FtsW [Actinomycetota bacterium]